MARLKKFADAMRADLGDSATKQKGNGFRPAGQLDEPRGEGSGVF
ncbi:MAG TPA: hypothetical protein VKE94_10835 [Gemmataceae bacterium]|nr:hypothetical protein [Gemmataceae bacterium]